MTHKGKREISAVSGRVGKDVSLPRARPNPPFPFKALFTMRDGKLPLHSHISSFFTRRVYKAGRITLALALARGLPYLP